MAKKSNGAESGDVNAQIKTKNKKTMIIIGIVALLCIGGGGFVGYTMFQSKAAEKAIEKAEIAAKPLKDRDVQDDSTIYTRDVDKQTYMLKNGAVQFSASLVFYNKYCANLYTGITDTKEVETANPDLSVADEYIGDKLMKNAVTKYIELNDKATLSSATALSEGLTKAINKEFKETFGHEILKDVWIKSHVVQ